MSNFGFRNDHWCLPNEMDAFFTSMESHPVFRLSMQKKLSDEGSVFSHLGAKFYERRIASGMPEIVGEELAQLIKLDQYLTSDRDAQFGMVWRVVKDLKKPAEVLSAVKDVAQKNRAKRKETKAKKGIKYTAQISYLGDEVSSEAMKCLEITTQNLPGMYVKQVQEKIRNAFQSSVSVLPQEDNNFLVLMPCSASENDVNQAEWYSQSEWGLENALKLD